MSQESYLRALARYSGDIRTGGLQFDYRTGQCAPVQATRIQSWGAACPTGFCPPENLPEALGRWFAGDRAGCREIPYTVSATATSDTMANVVVTIDRVSKVTMCPTRMLILADGATAQWELVSFQFGNQNQMVGGPVAVEAFSPAAFQVVPMVPDCLKAGTPFNFTLNLLPEAMANTREVYITLIGPTVG